MSEQLTRGTVESHLGWLRQRTEPLDAFHGVNYRLVLHDFCDWFVRDEVGVHLFNAIRARPAQSAKDWHDQANREGALPPLPADPVAAMGFRFACLRLIRLDKLDLQYFVTNHFPGTYLNAMLMHWKRLIVHPFAADCRTVARLGIERLGAEEWVDVPAFLEEVLTGPFPAEAFGPRAWTDEDDEREEPEPRRAAPAAAARPPAAAPPAPIEQALDALAAAVSSLKEEGSRGDLALDVEALRLEATRPTPRGERFAARLAAMVEQAPPLEGACAAVREAWSAAR